MRKLTEEEKIEIVRVVFDVFEKEGMLENISDKQLVLLISRCVEYFGNKHIEDMQLKFEF